VLADDFDPLGIGGGIRGRGTVLLWCRTHLE
jgi:hypothetical protein